jgi:hypothetical protein
MTSWSSSGTRCVRTRSTGSSSTCSRLTTPTCAWSGATPPSLPSRPGTSRCMSSSSAGCRRSTGRCRPASGSGCCSATRPSTGQRSQARSRSVLSSPSRIPTASVVEQQVLAKGRRALLCYGANHLLHANGPGALVPDIEYQTGVRTYVIADLIPAGRRSGRPGCQACRLPRGTVIPAAGTWLGQFNAGYALSS